MRTTLTINKDIALQIKKLISDNKISLKQAINDLLRAGLNSTRQNKNKSEQFKIKVFNSKVKNGIDSAKLNDLAFEDL